MSFGGGFGASTPATSAFSFGAAATNAMTPIKPAGFGSTGTFGFSTPAATTAPSLFGTPATTTQSLFGTPAAQPTTGFGTGASFGTPAATGFGTATTTTASTSSTPGTNFGFGSNTSGFGTTPGASTSAFGGLGSTAPTSTIGPTCSGFNSFGFPQTSTSNPILFSGFSGTLQAQQPTFGTGTNTAFSNFQAKPLTSSTTSSFGNFGTAGSTFPSFGGGLTQQQQIQPQVQQNNVTLEEQLCAAVFNCQLFGDERDNVMAKWNLIQALWGTGKAYYSLNAPPIELNQENPLCKFKAIGYSVMPESDNNDGLLILVFQKKKQELIDGKQQLLASIGQILGNKTNLTVTVDNIKSITESKCHVTIFVTEKGVTGSLRKIPANELFTYLNQTMQKQQLTQIGVEDILPYVKLDPAQIKEYLDNPPAHIDVRLWKQAQLDNPNPHKFIPVPMIGFEQVKFRLKQQEAETAKHRAFLDMSAESIQSLQRQHIVTQARLKEHRRTLLELQHRVLQVLVRQEITRKIGFSLQPEEEVLTNKFEAMHSHISAPTQFKGRISEMLSQLRMRRQIDSQHQERYTVDPIAQDDIKSYLNMEQQGMKELIETVNTDLESLRIIKDGMSEILSCNTGGM